MRGTTDAQQRMVSERLLLEVLPFMCNVSKQYSENKLKKEVSLKHFLFT